VIMFVFLNIFYYFSNFIFDINTFNIIKKYFLIIKTIVFYFYEWWTVIILVFVY